MSRTEFLDLKSRLDACWEMGRSGLSSEGLAEAQALLVRARQTGDRSAIAFALTCNGWFCLQLGYPDEGVLLAAEARAVYGELGDSWGQGLAGAVYAWLLVELGLSDLAFEAALPALEAAERTDDLALCSFAMSCKGTTLLVCRQDELGFPILQKAHELAEQAGDPCSIALTLINMAYSLMSQAELAIANGDMDAALDLRLRSIALNDRAVEVARGYGDLWNLRIALCNGAEAYALFDEMAEADRYLSEWQGLGGKTGPREQIHYLYTRGEVLTRKGALAEALAICREAVDLAAECALIDHRASTLRRLSEVEAAIGDHEAALQHFRAYHEVFVSLMGELTRRRAQVSEMQQQNERLREKARRLEAEALQDLLTGLANRRAFNVSLRALQGRVFSLAILDLDHFKSINDRFSHIAGDAVLVRVGALLLGWDGTAQAFRLGGEEFGLLMENVDVTEAGAIVEAVRKSLANAYWGDLVPGHTVTASFGVTDSIEFPGSAMMAETDRRLYEAKAAGRNCVVGGSETVRLAAGA